MVSGSKSRRNRSSSSSSSSPERTDSFGRVIPKRPKRVSRTRTHSRSRSRDRSRQRSRDRNSRTRHSRSPRRRRDEGLRPEDVGGRTDVEDPKYLNARVFIGNLPSDKITKPEIEKIFSQYGKILGVSVHDRGFAFVQFEEESCAHKAVENETGSLLKGNKVDVKMAAEGRRNAQRRRSPPPFDRDRAGFPPPVGGARGVGGASASGAPVRDRSPTRPADPYDDRYRDPLPPRYPLPPARDVRGLPTGRGDLSPLRPGGPYDDRDPYKSTERDSVPPGAGGSRGSLTGAGRDDPYFDDPYRRPPPPDDPYLDRYRDDPYRYRRDPYADPYRDFYREYPPAPPVAPAVPVKPPPTDCVIITMNSALSRTYADGIERRLKSFNIICEIQVIPEDRTIQQMIEDVCRRNVLFAIVINSQNEAHRSLTLNILHGTPQVGANSRDLHGARIPRYIEHRNMPLDDAMSLVARSFETYLQTQREKATPPAAAAAATTGRAAPPPFLPPTADMSYLLNLLADNRQLTAEELDKVITYLKDRREKLTGTDGRPAAEEPRMEVPRAGGGYGEGDRHGEATSMQREQQELQAKILSILNGGESVSPGAGGGANMGMAGGQAGTAALAAAARAGAANNQNQGGGPGVPSLINFDNPSVQKALDNLIQSGPNLLKNINTASHPTPSAGSGGAAGLSRDGGYNAGPYAGLGGQGQGNMSGAQRPMFGGGSGGMQSGAPRSLLQQQGIRRPY